MCKGVFVLVISFILILSSNQQCTSPEVAAVLIDGTAAYQGCAPTEITNCAAYDYLSATAASPVSKCLSCDTGYVLVGIADGSQ